jgi:glutamate-1-semialdehyde 2,1-aminomutase
MSKVIQQFERARQSLAGGVSSSTRVNQAIGHAMLFDRAEGCRVWDLDGREYIDLCTSHGATLLGHGHPQVREAVLRALDRGAPCSYESELHTELAELLCQTIPCFERIRFTGSGTEATMHCLRLARAYTGRMKVLRFEGNFHGYHDQFMWAAQDVGRVEPELAANSAGVTAGMNRHMVQIPYNDPAAVEEVFARHGKELAAAICEPVFYNAGCILPTKEFMNALRQATQRHGTVLIFDEVLSAFRMATGGAQEYLGVTPDLCTVGKAVGGGYPLSVFGGRKEMMDCLMPLGPCQHSGTYNGHPVPVAAALAAVSLYREPNFYPHIYQVAERLSTGLTALFARHQVRARIQGLGARFGIYFGVDTEVRNYADAQKHNRQSMLKFIASAIRHGVYFHDYGGGACHHGFCSAMTMADTAELLQRLDRAVEEMRDQG